MKHLTQAFYVPALALSLIVSSCAHDGQGAPASDYRDVSGYNAVSLETGGQLEIIQGDREGLTVTATPSMLRRISAEVRGGVLRIGYRGLFREKGYRPSFRLDMKTVKGIRAASSGAISAHGIAAGSLYIEASSSGTVDLGELSGVDARILLSSSGDVSIGRARLSNLEASLESRSDLTVEGETESMAIDASSSGSFNGGALRASSASISLSSSGGASAWVMDHLDARLSGKGNLKYFGTPATGSLSATGSGEIIGLGPK